MKKYLILLLIIPSFCAAQKNDPDALLNKVKDRFKSVKDYSVDVRIKIDVSFLKVPDTEAEIFFKQPDKVHIKSNGFALIPREALKFSPSELLKGKYTALFDREEDYEGHKTIVIKTIPLGESEDVILTTFWIDPSLYVIRKVEISTRLNGTFVLKLGYNKNLKYSQLPVSMLFQFNVSKLNIPKNFTNEANSDTTGTNAGRDKTGRVYLDYSNYKVNQGLPDSLFINNYNFKGRSRHRFRRDN